MPRLWVADVDAVQQDCDLLAGAAPYADVGLCSNWSALTDIDACCILQQIVNTLYWRRLNFLAAQYSDHSRCLPQCKRCARSRDLYVLQGRFLVGLGGVSDGIANHSGSFVGGGDGSGFYRCYAQYTDGNHASQTGKECIALPRKLAEAECLALVEIWFVHTVYC